MAELNEQLKSEQPTELVPFEIIRTETVLSRLPIHNLSKRGSMDIRITKKDEKGKVDLKWEISYSQRYGEARQLAYKIDTLVVNRRIDELGRPLPKIIKLGSLREIGAELGFASSGTKKIKHALTQDATTTITAKLRYKTWDGREKDLEAIFTRYSVVFTGEKLPSGAKANAVHLILNDPYWEVLNNAPARPLDYTYLKALSPASQRFYEIMSFRMFATIKYRQPEAKIRYSEYCMYSAQTRYFDYKLFKPQMRKIHKPHIASGYLAKARYETITDSEGKADWMLYYTPGPKALAEYEVFRKKKSLPRSFPESDHQPSDTKSTPASEPETPPSATALAQATELVRYFYKRFHKIDNASPWQKELEQAAQLIMEHGVAKAKYLVDFSCRVAPETHYAPQVFGGILQYTSRALADFQQQHHSRQQAQAKTQQQQQEERQLQEERERRVQLAERYHSLPPEEQARLEQQARANLVRQGYSEKVLTPLTVNQEIYRLMEMQEST